MLNNNTTPHIHNHISFRCPETIREQLEAVIATNVLAHSTPKKLHRVTRSKLILDAIINYYHLNAISVDADPAEGDVILS